MSISYVDDISDGNGAFIFVKILRRWKGSLYKLVWIDLFLYLGVYYIISLIYRFALPEAQKRNFEVVVRFCELMKGNIPVSFLLGFFVSGVIGRWYNMYMYIPWMNHIAYSTMSYVNCADKSVSKEIRLSLMRYMNLSWILLMRRISDQIADRFKQLDEDSDCEQEYCCKGHSKCCERKKKMHHIMQHPWSSSQFRRNPRFSTVSVVALPSEFQHSQHSVTRPPRTPFDGASSSSNRQLSVFKQTMFLDEGPNPDKPPKPVLNFDMFNAFEGEDEWSIRATLNGFNKDKKIRETFGKIITEPEIRAFEAIAKYYFKQTRQRYLPEYWVPIQWAVRLVQKAGLHGNMPDPRMIGYMFKEIGNFRERLQHLEIYSSLMMPLVYTQVVIIAVYSYFGCELLASQFLEVPKVEGEVAVDFFVPIFSIFYFLFLMGWLKVALCVMNPFGDDDEDFETSDILDYNLDVSYRTVLMDESTYPEQLKAPTFETKTMKGAENDNLREFVKSTHREMDKIDTTQDDNGLVNLEIKHKCCQCFPKLSVKKEEENIESSPLKLILKHKHKKDHPDPVDV